MILAARERKNAELILECHRLGYLKDDWFTLDPTFGKGVWWSLWRPQILLCHDIKIDGVDFRNLPYPSNNFHAVAYDPPYVAKGGRNTSGVKDMDESYGQDDCPATPALLQELINDGLTEMYRVVKPKGIVLVKCMNYISSGKLWIGTHHTLSHALDLGFEPIDWFENLGLRGQPKRTRKDGKTVQQVHARRNLSTLYVLKKPKS